MAGLADIRRKIQSVKNTQKITKAMKMVSAAKMRRAVEAVDNSNAYAKQIGDLVDNLAKRAGTEMHPFLQAKDEVKNICLIVITSDRGLCGAFNGNVIKLATRFMNENSDKNFKLVLAGKKANDYLGKKGYDVAEKFTEFAGNVVYEDAINVADIAVKLFEEGETDEVHVVYNEFKNTAVQVAKTKKILPLEFEQEENAETPVEYIYEPAPEALLRDILPKYVHFTTYYSMLESIAGEHGARMLAMDNASRNASDMIGKLSLIYNKARQAAITTEILDIVNGAEALNG
jgi:F-type H+-transporting ATPase subunit gamma